MNHDDDIRSASPTVWIIAIYVVLSVVGVIGYYHGHHVNGDNRQTETRVGR